MPVPIADTVTPRRLIRDEVFIRLLDAIVEGDLVPGEQLYDAEIEKWVGVSRTPVREALNQLAAMGLVEIMPQKRTRVTPIDPIRLHGLLLTLATLMRGVARDATPLLTAEDKQALRAFESEVHAADSPADIRDRLLGGGFTSIFVRRLDNRTIARLFTRHMPEVRRALIAAPPGTPFEKIKPYITPLIDAAVAGDGKAVAERVSDCWENGLLPVVDRFLDEKKVN